jgi:CheY-like chemotaxis protein
MSSHTILIADDYPDGRKLVASFLYRLGYEVIEAPNGAQAIKSAIATVPGLIFIDLRLPDMSALDVARALRRLPWTAHIPIVGWSIDVTWKPPRHVMQSVGILDCLEKPVSLTTLGALAERFVPKSQH